MSAASALRRGELGKIETRPSPAGSWGQASGWERGDSVSFCSDWVLSAGPESPTEQRARRESRQGSERDASLSRAHPNPDDSNREHRARGGLPHPTVTSSVTNAPEMTKTRGVNREPRLVGAIRTVKLPEADSQANLI